MPNRLKGALLLAALCATVAASVSTEFWSTSTYQEFRAGSFTDISLNREGAVQLAPALEEVFAPDQAVIWAVARDPSGGLYIGTGHSGRVYRLGQDLQGTLFFDASEPDIFALAVDGQGNVYVGTSPDGKVYKVDPSGASSEFFDPQARYIWSLAFSSDGSLFVGTGDLGRIYRVQPNGQGELYYDTEQSHVVSLALGGGDDLIAGTEPNGLLYRISPNRKGFVIYDAPQTEIRSVLAEADGSIYAVAMGGPQDRRVRVGRGQQGGTQAPVRTATTITVRASEDSPFPGPGGGPGGAQQPQQDDGGAQVTVGTGATATAGQVVRVGQGGRTRNALFRVLPDSTVETLWDSANESVFDVLVSGDKVLFSTDQRGRIYELTKDRRVSLLTETGQGETTRLIPFGDYVLATTANVGKVFRLGTRPAPMGTFESEVKDAGTTAGWGQIRWTADISEGTSIELYTRSGNSSRPDSTWSDWSDAYREAKGERIASPPARYLQWKAVLRSTSERSPVLREVIAAYLPRNRAPEVSDIRVTQRAEGRGGSGQGVTIVNSGGAGQRRFSGVGTARRQSARGLDIRWTGSDPDQDDLSYALYFRGEAETAWKLLEENVRTNSYSLDEDVLPDGKYRLKVVASDAGANAQETARDAETFSAPFLVDGTPPLVENAQTSRGPGSATAQFQVRDAASVLTRAEYALDADPLKPLLSEDGIIDSQGETFVVTVSPLDDREHLVTIRVYDSAGNVGVGKAVWPATGDGNGGNR